ncbi:unnamed protein product [Alopecurus aequalis]
MESPPSSSSAPSAAAVYPRWVMLDRGDRMLENSTGDASTSASCYSSTGHVVQISFRLAAPPAVSTMHPTLLRLRPVRRRRLPALGDARPRRQNAGTLHRRRQYVGEVSFRLAPPPAVSKLHVDARLTGGKMSGTYDEPYTYHVLVSAHRHSVLIQLYTMAEYFVYIAGDGGARPPRLLLLPPCVDVDDKNTGILRLHRGGDEFVVASLVIPERLRHGGTEDHPVAVEASMCVLRSGECKWEHRTGITLRHADGLESELSWWQTGSVIAVGDRFLYWIDLSRGVIFSDVTAEVPELRYVSLPADPLIPFIANGNRGGGSNFPDPEATRSVCVTVAGAVRFVRASPRCCCGGPGATACPRSRGAFTVTTWTLRMDDMTWEEDGVLDSDEPWAGAAATAIGVPLVPPEFPVVSVEDPDVVCFLSSDSLNQRRRRHHFGDKTAWVVAVDTRRKALRSFWHYPENNDQELFHLGRQAFLPSEVSNYFNTTTCHGIGGMPASREKEEEREVLAASQKDKEERQKVLAAIQEIPGMARDDMLRAQGVLAGDDRRVRFLAAIPVGMRKEYCMIMTELERNLRPAK